MTWENARTYCRSNYTDLASVRNVSESSQITSLISAPAWIGLHRKPWAHWSDQSPTTFTNWFKNQPDNNEATVTSCVVFDRISGQWLDVDCNHKMHFLCQKVTYHPHKATFKVKFQSEADLNDPDVQQQILEQVQ